MKVMSHIAVSERIFFSVANNRYWDYQVGDKAAFQTVFSDVGPSSGGWNSTERSYICPVDGYYQFTVSLYKSTTGAYEYNCAADLYRGDERFIRLNNYSTEPIYRLDLHMLYA